MKFTSLLKVFALGAGLVSSSLFANSIVVSGNADGSIWAVTSDNGSFVTFCLEKNVDIWAGVSYPYTVDSAAIYGGPNNNLLDPALGFGDTISEGTANLYLAFLDGTLGAVDAHALQDAIWALEDEIAAPAGNAYYDWALLNGGKANYTGDLVAVINPWDVSGDRESPGDVQSVLVRVPDGGTTAILLGVSLIGLAAIRRRK